MNKVLVVLTLSLVAALTAVVFWVRPVFLFPLPHKQNIVIILVDTLRPDHLGTYGYARDTSPAIDAIAKRGAVFTSAYSVSNWTNPTIKSVFTGLSPQAVMREAWHKDAIRMPLPEEVTTFAEWVKTRGYRTAALVDHPGISPHTKFNQGFEHYLMLFDEGAKGRGSWGKSDVDYVANQFGEQLDEYLNDPFLIYLHIVYPHRPYQAPRPYKGMFGPDSYDQYSPSIRGPIINAYDAEIRRADDVVAEVVRALESRGLLEDTWIIFLSDHGEGFWEHGFGEHGSLFFNEAIKVPLIIVPPKGQARASDRVDTPVSNLDVFATILDIAGIPLPEGTMGFSLKSRGSPARKNSSRILFSESAHSYDIQARTVIRDGLKYSNYPNAPAAMRHFLFNLRNDRFELKNLYGRKPGIQAELQALLKEHREQSLLEREWLVQKIIDPDERTLEGLRSLGYIQ